MSAPFVSNTAKTESIRLEKIDRVYIRPSSEPPDKFVVVIGIGEASVDFEAFDTLPAAVSKLEAILVLLG